MPKSKSLSAVTVNDAAVGAAATAVAVGGMIKPVSSNRLKRRLLSRKPNRNRNLSLSRNVAIGVAMAAAGRTVKPRLSNKRSHNNVPKDVSGVIVADGKVAKPHLHKFQIKPRAMPGGNGAAAAGAVGKMTK
ncbi:MAG: hypothetical protein RLZZ366_2455 [Pseudomonadota bacterium]